MESRKRKNPPRGARLRSSDAAGSQSVERAMPGRGTPSRGPGAAGASASDEGIPAPLHTHTVLCPPLSHRERVHSQAMPDPVQEEGRAMDPNVLCRSPLHLSEVGARRTLSGHPQFNAHVRGSLFHLALFLGLVLTTRSALWT